MSKLRVGLFSLGDVYSFSTEKEGVGLTITEARCTGMPVVTTYFLTMNEWLDDGYACRYIKTEHIKKGNMPTMKAYASISHLSKILEDYIKYPQQIPEQSQNARKLIEEKYNWDDRDQQILNLLKG